MSDAILSVRLRNLHDSSLQPRSDYPAAELQELAASIRAHGILQPLVARPINAAADPKIDIYELVFGHRRKRAAELAGLAEVPVIVRDMSDAEVAQAQLVENMQRADLHPLDEADALLRLHRDFGQSIDQIMAATGRSRTAIYNRLKLTTLGAEGRAALRAGLLGAEVATLVARVPPRHQAKAVELAAQKDWAGAPKSYRTVRAELLERFSLALAGAIFDTTADALIRLPGPDGVLAPVPACTACPRRSGAAVDLFGDIVAKDNKGLRWKTALGADVCTDPDCYAAKRAAHLAAEAERLRARGREVVDGAAARRAVKRDAYTGRVEVKGDYVALADVRDEIKKRGADVAAVTLIEPTSGKTVQAVRKSDLAAAGVKLAAEKPARFEIGIAAERERRAEQWQKKEQAAEAETARRRALYDRIRERLTTAPMDHLPAPVLNAVIVEMLDHADKPVYARWGDDITKRLPALLPSDKLLLLIDATADGWCQTDAYEIERKDNKDAEQLAALARHYGVDPEPPAPAPAWQPGVRRKRKSAAVAATAEPVQSELEAGDLEPAEMEEQP